MITNGEVPLIAAGAHGRGRRGSSPPAGRREVPGAVVGNAAPARPSQLAATRPGSHRDYARWRARQIAYGRWEPWTDAGPVREHVQMLRQGGASYHAIARAAGVSAMTVHRLLHGCQPQCRPVPQRIGSAQAGRLLTVTPKGAGLARRSASGSRLRLQALVALGHSPATLTARLGMPPQRLRRVLCGQTRTVGPGMHAMVCGLYERMWNQLPPERTSREKTAADAARRRAQAGGWPPPMALDDERIDDPAYRPRTGWRRAAGTPGARQPGHPAAPQAHGPASAGRQTAR